MSETVIERAPWSKRRWFATVVFLFVAQISLVIFLSGSPRHEQGRRSTRPHIHMVSSETYNALPEIGKANDPTLFALIHPKSFSGSAWLHTADFPYHLTNQMDSPRWLTANSEGLAQEFLQYIQSSLVSTSFFAIKPAPLPTRFAAVDHALILRPIVRIEGDLMGRRLISTQALPAADPDRILTNCVINVIVAMDGETLSATVRTSSGSPKTDQEAREFAEHARIEPVAKIEASVFLEPSQFDFGRLVFEWQPAEDGSKPEINN